MGIFSVAPEGSTLTQAGTRARGSAAHAQHPRGRGYPTSPPSWNDSSWPHLCDIVSRLTFLYALDHANCVSSQMGGGIKHRKLNHLKSL